MTKTIDVYVIGENESGLNLICSTNDDESDTFLLTKKGIISPRSYRKNQLNTFDICDWAWEHHKQLCGNEVFEKAKKKRQDWKKSR